MKMLNEAEAEDIHTNALDMVFTHLDKYAVTLELVPCDELELALVEEQSPQQNERWEAAWDEAQDKVRRRKERLAVSIKPIPIVDLKSSALLMKRPAFMLN